MQDRGRAPSNRVHASRAPTRSKLNTLARPTTFLFVAPSETHWSFRAARARALGRHTDGLRACGRARHSPLWLALGGSDTLTAAHCCFGSGPAAFSCVGCVSDAKHGSWRSLSDRLWDRHRLASASGLHRGRGLGVQLLARAPHRTSGGLHRELPKERRSSTSCVPRLRAGRTVLLLPWPVRRGAAYVALRSGLT